MPADRAVHVAVVDDLRINREGVRAVLGSIDGVTVEEPLDFHEAMGRTDWSGADYVLVDVTDLPVPPAPGDVATLVGRAAPAAGRPRPGR